MTTKQVLNLTATFLGKEDLLQCSYFTGENEEISADNQKELNFLLRCLNLIISEVTTDYLQIYKQKDIIFENNQIPLEEISSNVFRIVSLKDEYLNNIRFKIIDGKLFANTQKAVLTYTKIADEASLNGNLDELENLISDRALAYGTAMEYSYISELYDDAAIWETRYKNALLNLSHKKHNIIMPKRRWL